MKANISPCERIAGSPALPADKSIAHRTALLAALADGKTEIIGYPDAEDPQSTLRCLTQLGVQIEKTKNALIIHGVGKKGLRRPKEPLDCGNSGTTMRLLTGILSGQLFESVLTGDASLSARPMERIAAPLREMGAQIELDNGHAPITLKRSALHGITYRLPVASAQVKSCMLLAGLFASGKTTVIEPQATRDHTERMLDLPVAIIDGERHITVDPHTVIPSGMRRIPRDISAAAFFLSAAAILPNASLELKGVGNNPSRTAFLDTLRAMGGIFLVQNERTEGNEPIADIRAYPSPDGLRGVEVGGEIVSNLIDEIPVLAAAATYAQGTTVIRDARELRVKETDRIAATAEVLRAMGASVEEHEDGLQIEGEKRLQGGDVDAAGDHRIAMAAAVAALGAEGPTTIHGAEAAAISFPGFWEALRSVTSGETVVLK